MNNNEKIAWAVIALIIVILIGYFSTSNLDEPDDPNNPEQPDPLKVTVMIMADDYDGLVLEFEDPLPNNTELEVYYDGEKVGEFLLKQVILGTKYKLDTPGVSWFSDKEPYFKSDGIDYTIKYDISKGTPPSYKPY